MNVTARKMAVSDWGKSISLCERIRCKYLIVMLDSFWVHKVALVSLSAPAAASKEWARCVAFWGFSPFFAMMSLNIRVGAFVFVALFR